MKSGLRVNWAILLALALGACGAKPLYYWGPYEGALYSRLVEDDPTAAAEVLEQGIAESRANGYRVGPGVRAELAYLLFLQGRDGEAVALFREEAVAFPESAGLMTSLADRIEQRDRKESGDEGGSK
jgi:hypothetical protein